METLKFLQDLWILTWKELNFLFDIILCIFIGYIIWLERESRGKDAWISTNAFVIFWAMLFTFLSVNVDPNSTSRIASQIVSWVGFLWAWLIIKEWTDVRNLTTAASIWFSAAIWMAVWFWFYFVAILSAIVAILIPRIPHINNDYKWDDIWEMTLREKDAIIKKLKDDIKK